MLRLANSGGERRLLGPLRRVERGVRDQVDARVKPVVRWGVGQALPRAAMRGAARKGDLQGRLIGASPGVHTEELHGLFEEVRAAGPVHKGGFSYVTVSHQHVREVLSSNDFRTGILEGRGVIGRLGAWSATDVFNPVQPPSLLATEPPDHTRYRKLVTRVFSARAVAGLRSRTEQIATELLDDLDARDGRAGEGPVDLITSYCGLLPVTVISEILGVPTELREWMLERGAAAGASLDLGLGWRRFREVETALAEFDTWLTGHLKRLRAQPGDDLLSQLVAVSEDGRGLNDQELRATAGLVFAAGFETTVNLLGNGIALLCDHPDQLALLRARPELWPNAVDEILRLDPPVLLTGRVAARDTEVAGVRIGEGAVVTTVLAAANLDPDVFADPHTFDVTRENAREHISFSAGRHYCLGAQLARMEGEVGLRAVFDRYADLRLLPGRVRRPTRILRGYEHLPAVLGDGESVDDRVGPIGA
ncbi:MAG: cytochrome P450 [Nocardioides sp.]|uniref:cytochrome P450 n=1 Tax=Nocardioides sp. TaxID=35761 RepID=UPI0039E5AAD1